MSIKMRTVTQRSRGDVLRDVILSEQLAHGDDATAQTRRDHRFRLSEVSLICIAAA